MMALAPFFALPAHERRLAVEACLCLLAVRLVLGILPFRVALRLLRAAPAEAPVEFTGGRIDPAASREIARAIARAARHAPFRALCLQQAFAALLMLRRRGLSASVHLGLAREAGSGALAAHAWCRCGALPVTGVEAADGFVPVAVFAASGAL